jgi:hypothetical protein
MKKSLLVLVLFLLLGALAMGQVVKPPYILGKNDERIKSKNFLAGKRARYGAIYEIYNDRRGPSIEFNKRTNEFEIVTGAENTSRSIRLARQQLRNAEKIMLGITGVAAADRCKLKVLMRIVVPGTTDGGVAYAYLPSCGDF